MDGNDHADDLRYRDYSIGYLLFRRNSTQVRTNGLGKQNSGLDILSARYAHGEIDSTEYQSQKKDSENR